MVDTETPRVNIVDKLAKIAEMSDVHINEDNLRKARTFLIQDKTPCGHVYMGSVVRLNYIGDILDKMTIERPYQIRDVHDIPLTLTETFRVYSRARV